MWFGKEVAPLSILHSSQRGGAPMAHIHRGQAHPRKAHAIIYNSLFPLADAAVPRLYTESVLCIVEERPMDTQRPSGSLAMPSDRDLPASLHISPAGRVCSLTTATPRCLNPEINVSQYPRDTLQCVHVKTVSLMFPTQRLIKDWTRLLNGMTIENDPYTNI
ncbi:hypothetical protein P153DRAFT_219543 [Dothidotthia symphoricarpi CBS 119687]|uniref:Uncharacterized protein n=1 Tax=Dothidotthia symphoricarpi CBS 119687 TaxID=1392245 RepID=A0A6A6AHX3_9PLEO|nr:uncharacterized protein P153DRAFT_219543 [Dothidotthia symphoricarpi CBS 119687]KAF2130507.1 hypothetical protein P153DRAFT_219543 [Dothidotthia symphoricarpi CBS 119687]